tara:strand:- start:26 stop:739 length:714 start_codon:yes stop_codon:yes gene_type:complete
MNNEVTKPFLEHLDELRSRIIKSFLSVILFSVIGYFISDKIIELLILPINNYNISFQVLKITSIFSIKIGLSVVFGVFISVPVILYQMLKFVLPAFNRNFNRAKLFFSILIYLLFFLLGLLFGYFVLIPTSLSFFTSLSIDLSVIELNYTLENYLIYLIWILIISSFIFQLPFFIILLTKLNLVNSNSIVQYRRHIIVLFFILAALFTPPDPVSQILVVIPLYCLFEFSILLSKYMK